ncbi:MAG: flagellar basal body-associated FliL family protein [Deltaproteobacteria bacterium]|nr:flagellar basal body-associated FliL family protein [Deltaproteobacteria bacterium]
MDFDRGGKMAEEESEGGGGGGKKIIIIIIVVLLLLGGGGAAAWFLLLAPEETAATKENAAQEELLEEERERASNVLEKAKNPVYFPFKEAKLDGGDYIISLMDGKHFLRVKMVAEMEMDEESAYKYLEDRRALIDDMIITYFATMDSGTVQSPASIDRIKKQMKKKLNALYDQEFLSEYGGKGKNPVKRVLITKIILN